MRVRQGIGDVRDVRWMLGLGLLALAARLTFVLAVHGRPFVLNDTFFYHSVGAQIAQGHGYVLLDGSPTAGWPPVYTTCVGLIYRIFGVEPTAVEVFNALVGATTVPLLYFVARRALGRREAIFAGLFMAALPGQVFFTDVLLSETLATFEVVAFFALLVALPDRRWTWAVLGVAAAITGLTRAEGVLLMIVPIAMAWKALPRRELAVRTAIGAAAALLCIAPWTIRNATQMHAFIPISNNFGGTLWAGHNAHATGGALAPPPELVAPAERYTGGKREIERGKILQREAVDWAVHHPLQDVALIPGKVAFMVRGNSAALDWWVDASQPRVMGDNERWRLGMLADVMWFALFTLTVTSMLVFRRALWRNRYLLGALAYLLVYVFLYCIVFVGDYRYRAPIEPLLILVAAPLVARLGTLRRQASLPAEG